MTGNRTRIDIEATSWRGADNDPNNLALKKGVCSEPSATLLPPNCSENKPAKRHAGTVTFWATQDLYDISDRLHRKRQPQPEDAV